MFCCSGKEKTVFTARIHVLIVCPLSLLSKKNEHFLSWIQYGGADQKYEAVDTGVAVVIEIIILPQGRNITFVFDDEYDMSLS